jgi:tRNA-dihydrouridine synthase A
VIAAGADLLIVHARKAWLKGLSPRENRSIPPLDYGRVRALKQEYPDVPIVLNGGLIEIGQMQAELAHLDGVMIGRAAYQDPAILMAVDPVLFGESAPVSSRHAALEAFMPYVEARLADGVPLASMTRHVLGLYNGLPGARAFRRHLATEGVKSGAGLDVLRAAMNFVPEHAIAEAAE